MRTKVLLLTSSAFLNRKYVCKLRLDFGRCLHSQATVPDTFRKERAWKRLRHLVDLTSPESRTVADIGTDHGLLALALASSGAFRGVIGVDCSESALRDGAQTLPKLPGLSFREGDGLKALNKGEADTVCVAGMGVNTMKTILGATDSSGNWLLDELQTHQLVLQPTNSRPRNLHRLYTNLQNMGWQVDNERIEYLSKRWYLSSSFARKENAGLLLPGDKLVERGKRNERDATMDKDFRGWVAHHCRWIQQDQARGHCIDKADLEWLSEFGEVAETTG